MLKLNYSYYIVKDGKGKEKLSSYIDFNQAFRLIDIDKDGCYFDDIGMDVLFPLDESYYEQWIPEIDDYVIDLTSINNNSFNITKIIDLDIDKNEYQIEGKILTLDEIQPYYGIIPRLPKKTNYNPYNDFEYNGKDYKVDSTILCSSLNESDIFNDLDKEMIEVSNNIDKLLENKEYIKVFLLYKKETKKFKVFQHYDTIDIEEYERIYQLLKKCKIPNFINLDNEFYIGTSEEIYSNINNYNYLNNYI